LKRQCREAVVNGALNRIFGRCRPKMGKTILLEQCRGLFGDAGCPRILAFVRADRGARFSFELDRSLKRSAQSRLLDACDVLLENGCSRWITRAMIALQTGSGVHLPRVVAVRSSDTYHGDDWLGLRTREANTHRCPVPPSFNGLKR